MDTAGEKPEALALDREPLLEPRLADRQALNQLAAVQLGCFVKRRVVRRAGGALHQPRVDPRRSLRPGNGLLRAFYDKVDHIPR